MAFPFALAIPAALQIGQGLMAKRDMDKANNRAEKDQRLQDAIAAFRGTPSQQVRPDYTPSGGSQFLSVLSQLSPLLSQIKWGSNVGGGMGGGGSTGGAERSPFSMMTR